MEQAHEKFHGDIIARLNRPAAGFKSRKKETRELAQLIRVENGSVSRSISALSNHWGPKVNKDTVTVKELLDRTAELSDKDLRKIREIGDTIHNVLRILITLSRPLEK